ncbi:hypothetical protein D9757_014914 [Collybiopsis confluens]|uniref:Uncharacterized protein n=1 Tax=Collybiopsis confluens TaxID=2823264 RepID=A0A8H5CAC7_9AGAR|nr:hypothetical protein D9757_014914 [Collybiopsis confluens]
MSNRSASGMSMPGQLSGMMNNMGMSNMNGMSGVGNTMGGMGNVGGMPNMSMSTGMGLSRPGTSMGMRPNMNDMLIYLYHSLHHSAILFTYADTIPSLYTACLAQNIGPMGMNINSAGGMNHPGMGMNMPRLPSNAPGGTPGANGVPGSSGAGGMRPPSRAMNPPTAGGGSGGNELVNGYPLFKDGHRFNRKFKRRKSYEHSISISTDTSIAPSAPIIAGSVPSALPRHLPPLARNLQQDTVKKTSEPRRQELSNAVAPVAKRPTDFETLSTILGISRQEVLEPDMAGDPKSPSRMGSSIPHPSGSGSSNFLVDVEAPSENLGRKLPNEYLAALIRGMNDSDVDRLQPGKYLNDSLIEYGLRVQGGYERVKNWTLNKSNPGGTVDIFAKEFIVVPIHEE